MTSEGILATIISGAFGVATVLYVQWDNRRVRRETDAREATRDREDDERRNDPELARIEKAAFERARASYDAALATAERETAKFEDRIRTCEARAERAEAQARAASERATDAEVRASAAERRAGILSVQVSGLRAWLATQDITPPPHLFAD